MGNKLRKKVKPIDEHDTRPALAVVWTQPDEYWEHGVCMNVIRPVFSLEEMHDLLREAHVRTVDLCESRRRAGIITRRAAILLRLEGYSLLVTERVMHVEAFKRENTNATVWDMPSLEHGEK